MTATVHFYVLSSGMVAVIGIGVRISYQVGMTIEAFRKHVRDDDAIHADVETRIRALTARKR